MLISNSKIYNYPAVNFKSQKEGIAQIINKPIEKVENIVSNTVDTFIPEQKDEEKKQSHKKSLKVGSTVLVIGALVALLNPRFSSKFIDKMKVLSAKAESKAKNNKGFIGKVYKWSSSFVEQSAKILNFANNYNSIKDSYFKKWCTKKTQNKNTIVKKADSIFVGIMKKPHEFITKTFDSISKNTVYRTYSKARSSLNILDTTINSYKNKLSPQELVKLDELLAKARISNKHFSEMNVKSRLNKQEKLMSNLEDDTMKQIKGYFKGVWNGPNRKQHIKDNMTFWAEEILRPTRNVLEENGKNAINSVIGKDAKNKGVYEEIFELLSPHLNQDEKNIMQKFMTNAEKRLNKANQSECVEYFNKKRDLMLGSAPTDIVTALIGLGASGIAIGTADTKEDRYSRALTVAFPAIAGLGVATGMTAMLFSGVKGMLCGFGSSIVLSRVGSALDKSLIHNNQNSMKEEKCLA